MKKYIAIGAIMLFLTIASFVNGHTIGYREGSHDAYETINALIFNTVKMYPYRGLQSNCYTPDDERTKPHDPGMLPCAVVEQ